MLKQLKTTTRTTAAIDATWHRINLRRCVDLSIYLSIEDLAKRTKAKCKASGHRFAIVNGANCGRVQQGKNSSGLL